MNKKSGFNSSAGFCARPKTLICYICGKEYGTASLPIHIKSCEKKWEQQQMLLPRNQRRPLPNPPPGLSQLMGKNQITMHDVENFNEQAFDTYNQEGLVKCPYCNRSFNQDRIEIHGRICTREKPFKPLPGAGVKQQKYELQEDNYQQQYPQKGKQKYNQYDYDEPDEPESYPMYQKGQQQQYEKLQPKKGILKKGKQNYNEEEEYNYSGGGAMLMACKYCGRKFNPDRVEKHENASKKVKYFGAFGKKVGGGQPVKSKPEKKLAPKWRQEHQELINGIRSARQYSGKNSVQPQFIGGGAKGGYAPQTSSYNSSLVPCPHCGRKFNEKAAERHIPSCANVINKPKGPLQQMKQQHQQKLDYFDDIDNYDPFAYKEPKASSTQKQAYRKQFEPDQYLAPPTVKPNNKASTTAKKKPQKPQQHQDFEIGGGGGGCSYLEKLEQQYNKGGRNVQSKPTRQTQQSPGVQFIGGASKINNGGMGGGGGAFDPTSNAHQKNLIFADSNYASTYQTTYSNSYSNQKQNQNVFSVPGQQKSYVDAPFQTSQNQGYSQMQQNQQPKGYKYDF